MLSLACTCHVISAYARATSLVHMHVPRHQCICTCHVISAYLARSLLPILELASFFHSPAPFALIAAVDAPPPRPLTPSPTPPTRSHPLSGSSARLIARACTSVVSRCVGTSETKAGRRSASAAEMRSTERQRRRRHARYVRVERRHGGRICEGVEPTDGSDKVRLAAGDALV